MTETAEQVKCQCGLAMKLTRGGGLICPNCDTVSVLENMGIPRRRTVQDVRFDLYWLAQMNKEYGPLPDDVNTDDLTGDME